MKKILFLSIMAVMYFQTIDAQRRGGEKRTPEQVVENLDKKLDLTDEQEKQITELYKDFFNQKLSRDERKTKMDELNSKISSLLTDEQKAKFDKMKSERSKRK
ncbi:hypothetical protein I6E11_00600 [Bacteroides caecigallinarum]|uniref:hypothetical protein n=1 Tax=Bacteroides caecigallinarum TaxID=1411144 RepID=UPI001F170AD8|nr:hypothetical protein [Bacteroides caecigallinarum]MCF2592336.1 hypothetical protein [Bacteroides caecigallinarum]